VGPGIRRPVHGPLSDCHELHAPAPLVKSKKFSRPSYLKHFPAPRPSATHTALFHSGDKALLTQQSHLIDCNKGKIAARPQRHQRSGSPTPPPNGPTACEHRGSIFRRTRPESSVHTLRRQIRRAHSFRSVSATLINQVEGAYLAIRASQKYRPKSFTPFAIRAAFPVPLNLANSSRPQVGRNLDLRQSKPALFDPSSDAEILP